MAQFDDLQNPNPRYASLGFQVGEIFPQLVLPGIPDGEVRSLADYRGRKVLLHIFASW